MESGLKQRLIGAAVLVALAVIFLPMLVQGPAPESGVSDVPLTMPEAPQGDYRNPRPAAGGARRRAGRRCARHADATPQAPPIASATTVSAGSRRRTSRQRRRRRHAATATTLATASPTAPAAPQAPAAMLPRADRGRQLRRAMSAASAPRHPPTRSCRRCAPSQLPAYRESRQRRRQAVHARAHRAVSPTPRRGRSRASARRRSVRDVATPRVVALDAEAATAQRRPSRRRDRRQAAADEARHAAHRADASPRPRRRTPAAAGIGFAVQLGAFSKPPMPTPCATSCAPPVSAHSPKRSTPTRAR